MPLDVMAIRQSELAATGDPASNWFAVILWCAAWHQIPAGSLPNDDRQLAYLAGLGRDLRTWKRYRSGALHGFELASDGRLYHPIVAAKVVNALKKSKLARDRAESRWGSKNDEAVEKQGNLLCNSNASVETSAMLTRAPIGTDLKKIHEPPKPPIDRNGKNGHSDLQGGQVIKRLLSTAGLGDHKDNRKLAITWQQALSEPENAELSRYDTPIERVAELIDKARASL
jgi:hypothetical protein